MVDGCDKMVEESGSDSTPLVLWRSEGVKCSVVCDRDGGKERECTE